MCWTGTSRIGCFSAHERFKFWLPPLLTNQMDLIYPINQSNAYYGCEDNGSGGQIWIEARNELPIITSLDQKFWLFWLSNFI